MQELVGYGQSLLVTEVRQLVLISLCPFWNEISVKRLDRLFCCE